MTVRVVTDSTADLPAEVVRDLDITVVPAYIGFKGRTYRDGVDIGHDELYKRIAESDALLTTSQPAPSDFAEAYRRLLMEADEIVSIQVTSKLSGTCNSAIKARDMVGGKGRIEVVDSEFVSMGLGLITIAAARLAKSSASLGRVLDEARQNISHTHAWGLLDTMKYVLRSGRLGKAKSLLGSMLSVKPMLTMHNGELLPAGLVRTRLKGLEKLLDIFKGCVSVQEVGIVHSTTPDEAQWLKCRLSALLDASLIHVSRLGPALGVHGGPGTLILALREKISPLVQESSESERTRRLVSLPSFHMPRLNLAHL